MYLMQIVAYHLGSGCEGGSDESKVLRSLEEVRGVSAAMAQAIVDMAVRDGTLTRRVCYCSK